MATVVEKWSKLCSEAKMLREKGDLKNLEKALGLYKEAQKLNPNNEKLIKLIAKIEDHLEKNAQQEEEEEEEENNDEGQDGDSEEEEESEREEDQHKSGEGESMVHMGEGYYIAKKTYDALYGYQKEGVLYLYRLFKARKGGLLGDDMGLGKTVQVAAYLSGMFDSQRIKTALIVMPPPLISNWEREMSKWTPGLNVVKYHECTKKEKEKILYTIQRRGGVCLTTYNTVMTSYELLSSCRDRPFTWDYCILDEGHKIKNAHAKTAKACHGIRCNHRVILTGTPIMNNLKELWSLFDWTHQGQLLGTSRTFGEEYENPITRARQKDASANERRHGEVMSENLGKLIQPYILRRLKNVVMAKKSREEDPKMPTMTRKNDLICWIQLSPDQERVYRDFLTSEEVKFLLNSTKSPLVGLTTLKKICDHPRLLSNQKCKMLGVSEELDDDEDDNSAFNVSLIPDETLIKEAGKMRFLMGLVDRLREEGRRCLIFSQSRRILDIVQKIAEHRGHRLLRLDGLVKTMAERQVIINKFQNSTKYNLFLLTTKVGGVGLTLTGADRVIIYDPSWNPSTDAQAVDRAFRIGQKQNVVVYRLITCGTVEEKIYRRQVYKDSICRKILKDSKNPKRHFSRQDLYQLFELGELDVCETQLQLAEEHRGKRKTDAGLEAHIKFLETLEYFIGISDHDLVFSQDDLDDDDENTNKEHFEQVVSQAMKKLTLEAEENKALTQQLGRYAGGGVLENKNTTRRRRVPSGSEHEGGEFTKERTKGVPKTPRRKVQYSSSDESDKENEYSTSRDSIFHKGNNKFSGNRNAQQDSESSSSSSQENDDHIGGGKKESAINYRADDADETKRESTSSENSNDSKNVLKTRNRIQEDSSTSSWSERSARAKQSSTIVVEDSNEEEEEKIIKKEYSEFSGEEREEKKQKSIQYAKLKNEYSSEEETKEKEFQGKQKSIQYAKKIDYSDSSEEETTEKEVQGKQKSIQYAKIKNEYSDSSEEETKEKEFQGKQKSIQYAKIKNEYSDSSEEETTEKEVDHADKMEDQSYSSEDEAGNKSDASEDFFEDDAGVEGDGSSDRKSESTSESLVEDEDGDRGTTDANHPPETTNPEATLPLEGRSAYESADESYQEDDEQASHSSGISMKSGHDDQTSVKESMDDSDGEKNRSTNVTGVGEMFRSRLADDGDVPSANVTGVDELFNPMDADQINSTLDESLARALMNNRSKSVGNDGSDEEECDSDDDADDSTFLAYSNLINEGRALLLDNQHSAGLEKLEEAYTLYNEEDQDAKFIDFLSSLREKFAQDRGKD